MATDKIDGEQTVVKPLFEFSGKLLNQMNNQKRMRNVIMSPVSIHQALSMVLLGSNNNSETKREILDTIGYSNMSEDDIERCHQDYAKVMSEFVRITEETKGMPANQLARRHTRPPILELFTMMVTKNKAEINANYERDIKKYFHASISNIDDRKPETKTDLLKKLNDWAEEAGFEGPIMELDYLNKDFVALLISAIRVEGFWFEEFDEGIAKNIFYNHAFKDKPVDGTYLSAEGLKGSHFLEFTQKELAKVNDLYEHMTGDESFNKLAKLDFRAIEVPLQGGLSFAIFEPVGARNESSSAEPSEDLNKLVSEMFSQHGDSSQMTNLAKALELLELPNNNNSIDYLRMPKFKFESDIDLKPVLKSIGLKRGFDTHCTEISNITRDHLFISDVKHKAFIETTEAGIKAAAVTIMSMSNSLSLRERSTRIVVRVENPFMFVLRYQKMPLFVGQLTNL